MSGAEQCLGRKWRDISPFTLSSSSTCDFSQSSCTLSSADPISRMAPATVKAKLRSSVEREPPSTLSLTSFRRLAKLSRNETRVPLVMARKKSSTEERSLCRIDMMGVGGKPPLEVLRIAEGGADEELWRNSCLTQRAFTSRRSSFGKSLRNGTHKASKYHLTSLRGSSRHLIGIRREGPAGRETNFSERNEVQRELKESSGCPSCTKTT